MDARLTSDTAIGLTPTTGVARLVSSNLRRVKLIKAAKANADLLEQKPEATLTAKEWLEIGVTRLEEGKDFNLPIYYCKKALADKECPPLVAAEAYYVIAVASHSLKISDDEIIENFNKAQLGCHRVNAMSEDWKEFERIASKIDRNLGIYYLSREMFPSAAHHFRLSLNMAKSSDDIKGSLPALTAYYALALCKMGHYVEGFQLFSEAEKLYEELSKDDASLLEDSLDYASFHVHKGRIYLQREEYEKAVKVLERGYELRVKILQAEDNSDKNDYADNRIGAAATLLKEARTKLAAQSDSHSAVMTRVRSGSPVHAISNVTEMQVKSYSPSPGK